MTETSPSCHCHSPPGPPEATSAATAAVDVPDFCVTSSPLKVGGWASICAFLCYDSVPGAGHRHP